MREPGRHINGRSPPARNARAANAIIGYYLEITMLHKTHSSSRIHGVLLILIIGFIGTLVALAEQDTKESNLQIPPRRPGKTELKTFPLRSTIQKEDGGRVVGSRETYCLNSYGITDIGMLRLAIENLPFAGRGRSSGSVILKDDSLFKGAFSGSTGGGIWRFEHRSIEGGEQYNWGGIAFTIVNGVFHCKEHSINALDSPKIVLFDDSKSIVSVEDFPTEVALAEQDAKVSDFKIPPRRQNETEASYWRRLVTKRANAARLPALPQILDKQPGETDEAHLSRLQLTINGLLKQQILNRIPKRTNESEEAYQARTGVFSRAMEAARSSLVARPGEEEAAYFARLTASKEGKSSGPKRAGESTAELRAIQQRLQRLQAEEARKAIPPRQPQR